MTTLSPSKITLYETCEFAYNHRYNQRQGQAVMEPTFFAGGRLFHRWASTYGQHLIATDSPFDQEKAAAVAATMPEGVPLELYENINGLFMRWARDTVFNNPKQTKTELRLAYNGDWEKVDWDDPSAVMRGILDRIELVDGELVITDYKTAYVVQPSNELAGKTYAYMIAQELGGAFRSIRYVEDYVRWGVQQEIEITDEDYKAIPAFFLEKIKEIEAKTEWGTRVSTHCTYCEAAALCPAYQIEVADNDLAIMNAEDAQALAEKVYVNELRLKRAKEMLKGHADLAGPITFGDQEFGPTVSGKVVWDSLAATLVALYGREDIPDEAITAGLSLNTTGLKKMLKQAGFSKADVGPEMAKIIEEHGKIKSETKFTFHKAKP